ncbi:ATP-binding cassette domain-containing protein [Sulfitobacter mediterraneus]|uniref:ATP-binding cassette domain-containing protein n=1 Tax=Sulfitobacter mediterraneus TaxID=83219 RepID=UPI0021A6F887|nr:ATP-binding cassette domain-containing protein [Sulfitobacter mediterraneus]UWR13410.1 ATP-binding cassette domain-containing protein [Sulfitobacter mediterraneus]
MVTKVSTKDIHKNYGAVEALRGISVDILEGDVHAICGDNGAGKSTLIKVLAGVEVPDRGEVIIDGSPCHFNNPTDALKSGVATIHQDLAVAPRMTIFQNIFMGAELTKKFIGIPCLDKKKMREDSLGYMSQLNKSITDMNTKVEELSGGQRQAVAICRALRWNADIVILDEPTAALGVRETEQVLELIRSLKEAGKTVILISHSMKDIVAVADRVTVLRQGKNQINLDVKGLSADNLSHYILSGDAEQVH